MYVLVLCHKTGPWHQNTSLLVLPYELGNSTYISAKGRTTISPLLWYIWYLDR